MDKAKGLLGLLALISAIVACIFAFPSFVIGLRQLSEGNQNLPTQVALTTPTSELSSPTISPANTSLPPTEVSRTTPAMALTPSIAVSSATYTPVIPTTTPSNTPEPSATKAICSKGNLAGSVESDIPGTRLCYGDKVTSVVDNTNKRTDVYAIDLATGQQIRFTMTNSSRCCYLLLDILNPDGSTNSHFNVSSGPGEPWKGYFTPAISGTFYIRLQAGDTGQTYSLNVSPNK